MNEEKERKKKKELIREQGETRISRRSRICVKEGTRQHHKCKAAETFTVESKGYSLGRGG